MLSVFLVTSIVTGAKNFAISFEINVKLCALIFYVKPVLDARNDNLDCREIEIMTEKMRNIFAIRYTNSVKCNFFNFISITESRYSG